MLYLLSKRFSKLVKLILSIDSHFEITEDKEDSMRLHLPNYKGNQPMDFHIYLLEPFLYISFVTIVKGERISCLNNFHQNTNQQDMFNTAMANNLQKVRQALNKKEVDDKDKHVSNKKGSTQSNNIRAFNLTEEQCYALYYYIEKFYYGCLNKDNPIMSGLFELCESWLGCHSKEEIIRLKVNYSHLQKTDIIDTIKSIGKGSDLNDFIYACVLFLDNIWN